MKKNMKYLAFLIITTLLISCSSDGNSSIDSNQLERIEITNSNDDIFLEINFSNGDMRKNTYINNEKGSDITYDNEKKITKMTSYSNGNIKSQLIFSYDDNGNIISVHDFKSNHTPQHQDRVITWNENTMSIPYIDEGRTDIYQYTFNNDNLLVNFKHILDQDQVVFGGNYVVFNGNYEYDENDNVIRKYGEHQGNEYNNAYYYDGKINPFYPYYKKYYKNNLIALGKPFFGYLIDNSIQTFGKNNNLKYKNLITNTYSNGYIEYTYNGNTTIQAKLKSTQDASWEMIYNYFYE